MKFRIAIMASTVALLVSSCGGEDPGSAAAEPDTGSSPTPAGSSEEAGQEPSQAPVVMIERALPCAELTDRATALVGKVTFEVARKPGEKYEPVPGADKVTEEAYSCSWSNESASAFVRIYPKSTTARAAEALGKERATDARKFSEGPCTDVSADFGEPTMGVVCDSKPEYGVPRSTFQVIGLFDDSMVACGLIRAKTKPAVVEEQGMAFCQDVIDTIGTVA